MFRNGTRPSCRAGRAAVVLAKRELRLELRGGLRRCTAAASIVFFRNTGGELVEELAGDVCCHGNGGNGA